MATALRTITHTIRGEREYAASIREIDRLLALEPRSGTPEDDRLGLLSVLVEAYESEKGYDLPNASPQELVAFMLGERGMTRASLAGEMGGRSRVSQFFRGERTLSIHQILRLHELLRIPVELLIEKPRVVKRRAGTTSVCKGYGRTRTRG